MRKHDARRRRRRRSDESKPNARRMKRRSTPKQPDSKPSKKKNDDDFRPKPKLHQPLRKLQRRKRTQTSWPRLRLQSRHLKRPPTQRQTNLTRPMAPRPWHKRIPTSHLVTTPPQPLPSANRKHQSRPNPNPPNRSQPKSRSNAHHLRHRRSSVSPRSSNKEERSAIELQQQQRRRRRPSLRKLPMRRRKARLTQPLPRLISSRAKAGSSSRCNGRERSSAGG